MSTATVLERIKGILKEPLAEKGYEVLQLRYIQTARPKLEFLLERLDEEPVTITDCTRASRLISTLLDVDDPIPDAYVLEVSSPGLDRPLVRLRDYERFKGHLVKFELHELREGQKRFKGVIEGVAGDQITFKLPTEEETPLEKAPKVKGRPGVSKTSLRAVDAQKALEGEDRVAKEEQILTVGWAEICHCKILPVL
jgi:ribosome maturation factor RimP